LRIAIIPIPNYSAVVTMRRFLPSILYPVEER
jgi:hypothetical protein